MRQEGCRQSYPRHRIGHWVVKVYPHPDKRDRYAYSLSVRGELQSGSTNSNPDLHGEFLYPFHALKAGVQDACYGETDEFEFQCQFF